MADFFARMMEFFNSTQIPTQFNEVDVKGLFTNGWFMIPFLALVVYQLFKQAFNNLALIGIGMGLWIFSGSHYVREIRVNGEIQMDKVLPLVVVGVVTLGIIIYLYFIRSDD
ncbi:MAG: hypothetical protein OEV73_00970 [Desulfobulbaceae bacterium]|nr:hypothetical protein [Desulfobulbaceae bacterium]